MTDGNGRILRKEHQRDRLSDDIAASDDDGFLPIDRDLVVIQNRHDSARRTGEEACLPRSQTACIRLSEAVDILIRIHKSDHFLCIDAFRKRHHHEDAGDFLILAEISHKRAQLFFCHIIGSAEDLCINAIALGDLLHKRCVHGRRLGGSGQNDGELGFIVLLTQFCKAQGELFFQSSRRFFSV